MKPTPLGKTYLEYQAELKEYNLAETYKTELGIADDVTALTKEITDLLPIIKTELGRIEFNQKSLEKGTNDKIKLEAIFNKESQKSGELLKEYEKAENIASQSRKKLEDTKEDITFQIGVKDKLTKNMEKLKSKGVALRNNLEKKLNILQKASKELGIAIPIGGADKVLSQLISLLK